MNRYLLGTVLLCALTFSAFASNGKIAGTVVDEMGDGVFGASVFIIELQQRVSVQNPDGSYVILGVPQGTYTIRITSVQYVDHTYRYVEQTYRNVVVDAFQTTELNATLTENAQGIEEQIIEWKPPNRRIISSTKRTHHCDK
jgi:hypothetical protein